MMHYVTETFEVVDSRGVLRRVQKWREKIVERDLGSADIVRWGVPSYRLSNGGAHLNTADERTFTHYVTGETYTRK